MVGQPSTGPLELKMTKITLTDSLTIEWQHPLDDGCLTIRHYIVNRDGTDLTGDKVDPD
jgi:hypothetical protein